MLPIAPCATGGPSRYPPTSSVPGVGAFTRRRYRRHTGKERAADLAGPWRKVGGAVASPAWRLGKPRGRSGSAAGALGAAAGRVPRRPPDARLPALRAGGRVVAEGRAGVVGVRAVGAAVE